MCVCTGSVCTRTVYVYVHVCVYVFVHVCVYVCVYVYVYVLVYVYVYVYVYAYVVFSFSISYFYGWAKLVCERSPYTHVPRTLFHMHIYSYA